MPGDAVPDFDVHIPLMSLPRIYQTRLGSIPSDVPYMYALGEAPGQMNNAINAQKGGKRIGIVWTSSRKGHPHRACSLSHFCSLTDLSDVALFSLQKEPTALDLEQAHNLSITDLSPYLV